MKTINYIMMGVVLCLLASSYAFGQIQQPGQCYTTADPYKRIRGVDGKTYYVPGMPPLIVPSPSEIKGSDPGPQGNRPGAMRQSDADTAKIGYELTHDSKRPVDPEHERMRLIIKAEQERGLYDPYREPKHAPVEGVSYRERKNYQARVAEQTDLLAQQAELIRNLQGQVKSVVEALPAPQVQVYVQPPVQQPAPRQAATPMPQLEVQPAPAVVPMGDRPPLGMINLPGAPAEPTCRLRISSQ